MTICFIGQNPTTCEFISWQLTKFLGDYINVTTWCLQTDKGPPSSQEIDVYMASSHATQSQALQHLGNAKEIMVAERTVNIQNLGKLLNIQPENRVVVVGSSEETSVAAMNIIKSLGFGYLNMTPYYPAATHWVSRETDLAVTMGLTHLVPEGISRVVDIGVRGIALSTFKRLMDLCDIPAQVLNDLTYYYVDALMHLCQRHQRTASLNETLKNEMEVILDTINQAIIAINEDNKILLYNPTAEKIFKLAQLDVLGENSRKIIPQVDLANCLRTGTGIGSEIVKIAGKYYVVAANPFRGENGRVTGVVATFRPVSEVQELDTKIRQELKRKGHVAKYTFDDIVGQSEELKRLVTLARRFSRTELTILLEGESGTGKEVLAQAIHNDSDRHAGPFVAINFAALTDNLAESELFGYIEGAFSGARVGGKKGLFEEAHKGTIFLDEIGDASLDVQKKILRVLEEGEVRRVGDNKITQVNVRVIAATNLDLNTMVEQHKFRQDLFYRLYALPLSLPPLRGRGRDVLLLFQWFAQKTHARQIQLEPPLVDFLTSYRWPGNIRELQNVVGYLSHVLEPGEPATIKHLPGYLTRIGHLPRQPELLAVRSPSSDFEMIAQELQETFTVSLVLGILQQARAVAALDKGVGRKGLVKRLQRTIPDVTEYAVRRCMSTLESLGFLESGVTRQGSRITETGQTFLHYLQNEPVTVEEYY